MTFSQELWITMKDGIRLDASVYLPEGEAPANGWPTVIVVHGHSDISFKNDNETREYAKKGYLGFCYSIRGQGRSEGLYGAGAFCTSPRDLFDLQDVLDWITRQLPVHPDRIAVVGGSQGGMHAYLAAIHCPQVRTVVAENIFTDGASFALPQGCLSTWFFTRSMRRCVMTAGFPEIVRQWAVSGDWHLIEEWMRAASPILFADRIRCPVLITHGWGDVGMSPNEAIRMFSRLSGVRKLIIGEGGHGGYNNKTGREIKHAAIDRWLAHWLKNEDTGIVDEPEVMYGRMPDWTYYHADRFPPNGFEETTLYLHADQTLQEGTPAQLNGHANVNNVLQHSGYDLAAAINDDLLHASAAVKRTEAVFQTETTSFDRELAGSPKFCFFMQPNHPCFQVHAELYDCSPEGERNLISRGHYGTRSSVPGQPTTIEFEGGAVSYLVRQGHTLKLVVSNCNPKYVFPFFHPFRARLFHDNLYPSSLTLPVRRL